MDNARLFSHFACGLHPETLPLARPASQLTRKVSHLWPGKPYEIRLCRVYKRRQTYYKPRARRCGPCTLLRPRKRWRNRCVAPLRPPNTIGLHWHVRIARPQGGRRFPPALRAAVPVRLDPGATARARRDRISIAMACRERAEPGFQLGQAASRRVRPKTIAAGSRWAVAGRRPEMRAGAVHARSGVGSATVHGRTRVRHKPSHTGRSIPRRARVPTRPDPVPCRFPTCRNHVGLLSEIHVGQEGAWRFWGVTPTCEGMACCGPKLTSPDPSGVEARSDSGVVLGRFLLVRNLTALVRAKAEIKRGQKSNRDVNNGKGEEICT